MAEASRPCSGSGSGIPIRPKQHSSRTTLNFKNHCLFCLQPQPIQTILELVGRNPKLSKDFQPIIHYLTGTDPTHDRSKEECDLKGIPVMANLPPMCPECFLILEELYRLHERLLNIQFLIQKQTDMARDRVEKTLLPKIMTVSASAAQPQQLSLGASARQRFESGIKGSGMPVEQVGAVIKFVEVFHSQIIAEAISMKKVIFPSSAPSDYTPPVPTSYGDPRELSNSQSAASTVPTNDILLRTTAPPVPSSSSVRVTILKQKSRPAAAAAQSNQIKPMMDSVLRRSEVIELPPIVKEEDDIKYEDEGNSEGDDDANDFDLNLLEPEMSMRLPGDDVTETGSDMPAGSSSVPQRRSRKQNFDLDPPPSSDPLALPSKGAVKVATAALEKRPRTSWKSRGNFFLVGIFTKNKTVTSQLCDLCGELFPCSDIVKHLEGHGVQDYMVSCPNPSCPFVFSCRGKLDLHLWGLKEGTPGQRYGSKHCRLAGQVPPGNARMICAVCGVETARTRFQPHLKEHEDLIYDKKLSCPIPGCSQRYSLRQSMEEHLMEHDLRPGQQPPPKRVMMVEEDPRAPHPLTRPLLYRGATTSQNCDLCGKLVASSEIVSHLEGGQHQVKDYIARCPNPSCLFVFSCRPKLDVHLRGSFSYRDKRHNGSHQCRQAAGIPSTRSLFVKCDTCGEETGLRSFQSHLQQHENSIPDKSLSCPIPNCGQKYGLRQSLEKHLAASHSCRPSTTPAQNVKQKCPVCKEVMKCDQLPEHLKTSHQVEEVVIKCKRCPFLFQTQDSLLDHLYEHRHDPGGLRCDICADSQLQFHRYASLRQHYFNVHLIGSKFICEHCDYEFFSQATLASHLQSSHSTAAKPKRYPTVKKKKCDLCPLLTFCSNESLMTHKIKEHGAPPVSCRFCSKGFMSAISLAKHENTHLGLGRTYQCRVEGCGREFNNMSRWKRHERIGHDPHSKLFTCETCGKGYNVKRSLQEHISTVHLGKKKEVKREICETCGESFAGSTPLKYHKLIHTGERPHQCSICGQAFRHRDVLKRHVTGHEKKGDSFKPNGPMKQLRKRVTRKE